MPAEDVVSELLNLAHARVISATQSPDRIP